MRDIEENAMAGANRYHMMGQQHDMAARKYAMTAKQAGPHAKNHRKMGKFHGQLAAILTKMAGAHTDHQLNSEMQKKQVMAKQGGAIKEHVDVDDVESHMRKYGWRVGQASRDSASFHHAKHEGHTIHVEDGEWHHHDDDMGTVASGVSEGALKTHLREFHKKNIKEENEMNESRVEQGLEDHHPRQVFGVRGAKSKPFSKKFKNQAHMEKWMDAEGDNHDIHSIEKVNEMNIDETLDAAVLSYFNTKPAEFAAHLGSLIQVRALEKVEELKTRVAEDTFSETEQVNELSKKTLGSYAKGASSDTQVRMYVAGSRSSHDDESFKRNLKKTAHRNKYIDKAVDKLTKEDYEQSIEELYGKGKLDALKAHHDAASRAAPANSNAQDYHSISGERAGSLQRKLKTRQTVEVAKKNYVDAKNKHDSAEIDSEHDRYMSQERRGVIKKYGALTKAREIDESFLDSMGR